MDFQHIEATFGKLEYRSLSFSKGLNIIEAPNESGKSTLLAFLRVMLYGFPPRERGALADKNRYAPWSLSPMRGTLALTCQKGDITLQRDTARANSPMGRFSAVYTGSGEAVDGLTAADEEVAHMLRRSHKPIILAVNKCDKTGEAPMELYEFYNLGFDEVLFDNFYVPSDSSIAWDTEAITPVAALEDCAENLTANLTGSSIRLALGTSVPSVAQYASRVFVTTERANDVLSVTDAMTEVLPDPVTQLVFVTTSHDTRFDASGVIRPLLGDSSGE